MIIMIKKYGYLIFIFLVIVLRLIYINVIEKNKWLLLLDQKTNNYVYGESAPRGRILDRNNKVLVDNIGVKSVYYHKLNSIKRDDEIKIAYELAKIINVNLNENSYKKFWLILNNNGDDLITKDEYRLYKERKLTLKDIEDLKNKRITDDMLDKLSILDKKSASIYYLMNQGYSYANKLIKKNINDEEYKELINNNIQGITTEISWERVYNYGNSLKDIFGRIGSIPKENKEEYLNLGYNLDDIVGLSYLEKEYDSVLKGEKDLYKVTKDNKLELIKEGKRGSDLVLSIDIDAQQELERLLKENIIKAKKRSNTDYFQEMFSIVGNPQTGEIIALSGQRIKSNGTFENVNTSLINTSWTVGSIVKMATLSTGYKNNVIDIGTSVNDGCIKLYQVPIKCSYKRLGRVNDLTAISKSSNYYQFRIALGLTNERYKFNMHLNKTEDAFNKLRNMYKEYGLGDLTGIDLPDEKIGIIGSKKSGDLLLNLTIGQYDTYTPMELFQYVNTLANNGNKKRPQLMKSINGKGNEYKTIKKITLEDKYIERLKEAMHLATTKGTARTYIDKKYNPAGKTGTSETFVDTNNDGLMDTKTTSIGFVGFAPYDNPRFSIIILAPNIYKTQKYNYSKVYWTKYVSRGIMNFLFEK